MSRQKNSEQPELSEDMAEAVDMQPFPLDLRRRCENCGAINYGTLVCVHCGESLEDCDPL